MKKLIKYLIPLITLTLFSCGEKEPELVSCFLSLNNYKQYESFTYNGEKDENLNIVEVLTFESKDSKYKFDQLTFYFSGTVAFMRACKKVSLPLSGNYVHRVNLETSSGRLDAQVKVTDVSGRVYYYE